MATFPTFDSEYRFHNTNEAPTRSSALQNLGNFSFLIPTIGTLALGAIYLNNVPAGIAIGLGSSVITVLTASILNGVNLFETNTNSTYAQHFLENPLQATLLAPILEEGIFRGALQPLAERIIIAIVPATASAFLGTGFSVATTTSIAAVGILFGIAHLSNNNNNHSHLQASTATIKGIIYGAATAQLGLAAAIAAHVFHNTLFITLGKMNR